MPQDGLRVPTWWSMEGMRQGETQPLLPAALFLLDGFEDDLRHRAGKENRVCWGGDIEP